MDGVTHQVVSPKTQHVSVTCFFHVPHVLNVPTALLCCSLSDVQTQLTPVFYVFVLCYQSTAPFLHIGALATFTAISWLVAGFVVRRERSSECSLAF